MPTQDEIDKKREEVAALREQVEQGQQEDAEAVAERTRQIEADRLDAEIARLKSEQSLSVEARRERNERKQQELDKAAEDTGELTPTPTPASTPPAPPAKRPTQTGTPDGNDNKE